jgi:hypothetical protein
VAGISVAGRVDAGRAREAGGTGVAGAEGSQANIPTNSAVSTVKRVDDKLQGTSELYLT